MQSAYPLVSVIIPHYNGEKILRDCLQSLKKCTYQNFEVIVVDNASTDESTLLIETEFPSVKLYKSTKNLGYSGGCNFGFHNSKGKYIVFLNNDTIQETDWLERLVEFAEKNPKVAALQPKLLFIKDKILFDYSGAAGGEMDFLGFPFARGRVFFTVEKDEKQHDKPKRIFWASGTACFLRREALNEVGLLDEDFFMHMEEIDLCWRINSAGYEVWAVPSSVVYHYSGASLGAKSWFKVYLNYRNNILMLLKNYSGTSLLKYLPFRIILDFAALLQAILKLEFWRAKGILKAYFWLLTKFSFALKKRKFTQRDRKKTDSELPFYRKSIAWEYFVRGKKKVD